MISLRSPVHRIVPAKQSSPTYAVLYCALTVACLLVCLCQTLRMYVQVPGAEKILYGLDDITGQSEVIIVEGEMDRLAMMEAGIRNVVSVPDGAPSRVRDGDIPAQEHDTKFSYLWNCRGAVCGLA